MLTFVRIIGQVNFRRNGRQRTFMAYEGGFQMIKTFVVLSVLLLLTGCSSQIEYGFVVNFRNVCANPVRVTALHYNNKREPLDLDVQVNPNEVVVILERLGYFNNPEDPENGIPYAYKLELSANGKRQSFDRESFLAILKKSQYEFDRLNNFWTINDPSQCP
jgi:hypothetical protein